MSDTTQEQKPLVKPPTLAAKADDLEAIRDAMVDAAAFSTNLWLSYVFILFYLLVAVGGVTQSDLIFESPVQLPFLGVALPLRGFFWLGPILFVIIHAYILMHISLLSEKIGVFDEKLKTEIKDDEQRKKVQRQLPNSIFVHFLAGPPESRDGIFGYLLKLIAWISLVFGPVSLLIFFQLQFLPYHDASVTWIQRGAVVIDLMLLWKLWPAAAHGGIIGQKQGGGRDKRRITHGALFVWSLLSLLMVFTIATFPDEWLEALLQDVSQDGPPIEFAMTPIGWVRTQLLEGPINLATDKQTSFWSDHLVLPNFDAIDHSKFDGDSKFAAAQGTISLRGRDLEGAIFSHADLQDVDFRGADVKNAVFNEADLRHADFSCTSFSGNSPPRCTSLDGALLNGARLQGASLYGADLQGASLDYAKLQGATLISADLRGATLTVAQLQGATLDFALLQGAKLGHAQLQGASLRYATLSDGKTPTTLDGTQFQGALVLVSPKDVQQHIERLQVLPTTQSEREAAVANVWGRLGCDADSAPYELRNLIPELENNSIFPPGSPVPSQLATTFLKEDCAGNRGLSDVEMAELEAISAGVTH